MSWEDEVQCACSHLSTQHWSKYMTTGIGCHATTPDGLPVLCKCTRSQQEVEAEFGKEKS